MFPFRQCLSLIALPVMILAATGADSFFVLCTGDDEHLEIEVAIDGKCVGCLGEDDHGPVQMAATAAETGHCGTCTDTEISLHRISLRSSKEFQPAVRLVAIPAKARFEPGPSHLPTAFFHHPIGSVGAASHLKTVRLLI